MSVGSRERNKIARNNCLKLLRLESRVLQRVQLAMMTLDVALLDVIGISPRDLIVVEVNVKFSLHHILWNERIMHLRQFFSCQWLRRNCLPIKNHEPKVDYFKNYRFELPSSASIRCFQASCPFGSVTESSLWHINF